MVVNQGCWDATSAGMKSRYSNFRSVSGFCNMPRVKGQGARARERERERGRERERKKERNKEKNKRERERARERETDRDRQSDQDPEEAMQVSQSKLLSFHILE